jgi:hypothetical protein
VKNKEFHWAFKAKTWVCIVLGHVLVYDDNTTGYNFSVNVSNNGTVNNYYIQIL